MGAGAKSNHDSAIDFIEFMYADVFAMKRRRPSRFFGDQFRYRRAVPLGRHAVGAGVFVIDHHVMACFHAFEATSEPALFLNYDINWALTAVRDPARRFAIDSGSIARHSFNESRDCSSAAASSATKSPISRTSSALPLDPAAAIRRTTALPTIKPSATGASARI